MFNLKMYGSTSGLSLTTPNTTFLFKFLSFYNFNFNLIRKIKSRLREDVLFTASDKLTLYICSREMETTDD